MNQQIATILTGAVPQVDSDLNPVIELAKKEVAKLLEATNDTMNTVCMEVERAATKEALRTAFRRLNSFTRFFLEIAPEGKYDNQIRDALGSLQVSARLEAMLQTVTPVRSALQEYKKSVVQSLADSLRRRETELSKYNELDDALLSRLPEPDSPSEDEINPDRPVADTLASLERADSSRKRASSDLGFSLSSPKKPKTPVLASIEQVTAESGLGGSSVKRALMTRERLRAGSHDPKGLLDLVSTSTNALEHTKRLELLKAAGFILNPPKNSSIAEKFNAAEVRLELGLGGHSVADTLLFGNRVLSTSGVLTKKNVNDIENNNVFGNTTWSHQNTYVKSLIAGCLNQAKRMVEK